MRVRPASERTGKNRQVADLMRENERDPKTVFVKTYGCQMNVYDSEQMTDALAPAGYIPVADAAAAAEGGASYLVAGHVWATPSHPGEAGRGCTWLREVVGVSNAVPVIAIGGVTRDRVPEVLETGAEGVAVLGGIWNEPDPAEAIVDYIQALNA